MTRSGRPPPGPTETRSRPARDSQPAVTARRGLTGDSSFSRDIWRAIRRVAGRILALARDMSISRSVLVCLLTGALLGAGSPVAAQAKYGVTVKAVKAPELAKAKTYVWTVGRPAFNKDIDALIIAAVDRQLSARGFSKVTSGPSNVVVTYGSLSRTDVELEGPNSGAELAVGTLIINLTDPATRQLLFSVRLDRPIDWNPATYQATVDGAVAAMFEKYPQPSKR